MSLIFDSKYSETLFESAADCQLTVGEKLSLGSGFLGRRAVERSEAGCQVAPVHLNDILIKINKTMESNGGSEIQKVSLSFPLNLFM